MPPDGLDRQAVILYDLDHGRELLGADPRGQERDDVTRLTLLGDPLLVIDSRDMREAQIFVQSITERCKQLRRVLAHRDLQHHAQTQLIVNHGLANVEDTNLKTRHRRCQHRHEPSLGSAGNIHQYDFAGHRDAPELPGGRR